MNRYAIAARWAMPRTVCASVGMSSLGGSPTSAASSSSLGRTAMAVTAPTAVTLTRFLAPSKSALGPKMFFAPCSGFRRFGSGFSAPRCGRPPTCTTLTRMPVTRHTATTGAAASPAERACSETSAPRPLWSTTSGVVMSANAARMSVWSTATRCGAVALRANSAASSTTAPLRSALLATWPFLRASWRRLGVAFSVLSPPPPPAISRHPERLERGADAALELVGEPAGGEREGHAQHEQPDRDLGGEAYLEDVELRHDARDDPERGVGEDDGEGDRRGQLERGYEHAGEGVLDPGDHRTDRRGVDERHER